MADSSATCKPNGGEPFRCRVMYVARAPFISGAERALLSMLRHLDRDRIEPMVVLGKETKLLGLVEQAGVPATVVGLPKRSRGSLFSWWRSVAQLTAHVRRFKPDIMHANDVPSCQALSVVGDQCRIPRVVHVRWGITAAAAGWWARRGAESVVCISDWVRRQLGDLQHTPLRDAHVEHLIDAVDWPAQGGVDEPIVSALNDDNEPCIGFAGQIIEDKGLDLIIDALGAMRPDDRPRLLVAGEDTQSRGAYKRHLQQHAEKLGVADRIEWLGFLHDVGEMYSRVHAVVCPSRVEPLGLVPLEAARYGVPSFASREGGLVETIDHNVTGVLVKPTVEAWAEALKQVQITAFLRELGRASHERTRLLYSPQVYQQKLMALYRGLLGAKVA
jgi:glycosyltransferase involved in cell wall biosynthesis